MATSIKMNDELKDRVQHLAERRQRSAHWIMREAITQYVEREEKREAFRQQAVDAWKEFRETGMHVSGDEVIAWLDTWGEDDGKAAPACHK